MTNITINRQEYAQGFGETNKQQRTEKHHQLDIWLGKCGGTSDTEINTETNTLKDFVRSLNQTNDPHKELVIYRMLKLTLYKLHDKVNKESSFRYDDEKLNNALTSCCVGYPDLQEISNYLLQDKDVKVDNPGQMAKYSRFKDQLTKFVAHRDNRIKTNQRPLFARLETTSFEKILMVLNSRISECQQNVAKSRRQPNVDVTKGKSDTPIQGAFEGEANTSTPTPILSAIKDLDITKQSATLLYVNCYLADFNIASIAQINQAWGNKDIDEKFFAALMNPSASSETDPEFFNINKLRTMIHQSCSKASQARELVKNLTQILKQETPASKEENPLHATSQSRSNNNLLNIFGTPRIPKTQKKNKPQANQIPEQTPVPQANPTPEQTPVIKVENIPIFGLPNLTGVNCYISSALQIVFRNQSLFNALQTHENQRIRTAANNFIPHLAQPLSQEFKNLYRGLINAIRDTYYPNEQTLQQSAADLMEKMFSKTILIQPIQINRLSMCRNDIVKRLFDNRDNAAELLGIIEEIKINFATYSPTLAGIVDNMRADKQEPGMINTDENADEFLVRLFSNDKDLTPIKNFINHQIFQEHATKLKFFDIEGSQIHAMGLNLIQDYQQLNALMLHSGTGAQGHYISLIKSNNQWYQINDNAITSISTDNLQDYIPKDYHITAFTYETEPAIMPTTTTQPVVPSALTTTTTTTSVTKTPPQQVLQEMLEQRPLSVDKNKVIDQLRICYPTPDNSNSFTLGFCQLSLLAQYNLYRIFTSHSRFSSLNRNYGFKNIQNNTCPSGLEEKQKKIFARANANITFFTFLDTQQDIVTEVFRNPIAMSNDFDKISQDLRYKKEAACSADASDVNNIRLINQKEQKPLNETEERTKIPNHRIVEFGTATKESVYLCIDVQTDKPLKLNPTKTFVSATRNKNDEEKKIYIEEKIANNQLNDLFNNVPSCLNRFMIGGIPISKKTQEELLKHKTKFQEFMFEIAKSNRTLAIDTYLTTSFTPKFIQAQQTFIQQQSINEGFDIDVSGTPRMAYNQLSICIDGKKYFNIEISPLNETEKRKDESMAINEFVGQQKDNQNIAIILKAGLAQTFLNISQSCITNIKAFFAGAFFAGKLSCNFEIEHYYIDLDLTNHLVKLTVAGKFDTGNPCQFLTICKLKEAHQLSDDPKVGDIMEIQSIQYLEPSMPEFKEQKRNEQMALRHSNSLANITPKIIIDRLTKQFKGTTKHPESRQYKDYLKRDLNRTPASTAVFTSANPQEPLISIEFATQPNLRQIADENRLQPWQQTALVLFLDQNIMLGLMYTIETAAHNFKNNENNEYDDVSRLATNRKLADCKITFNDNNTMIVNYTITSYYHTPDNLGFSLTYDIQLQLKPTEVLLPNQAGNTINIADITDSTLNFLDLFEITNAQLNSVTPAKMQHDVQLIKRFVLRNFKNNLVTKSYSALEKQLEILKSLDEFDTDQIILRICSDNDVPNLERVIQLTTLIDLPDVTDAKYPNIIIFRKSFKRHSLYTELQPLIKVKKLLASSKLNSTTIQDELSSYSVEQLAQLIDNLSKTELDRLTTLVTAPNSLTYSGEQRPLTASMLKTKQQLQESPSLLDDLYRDSPPLFSSRLESLASTKSWDLQPLENCVNNSSDNIFDALENFVNNSSDNIFDALENFVNNSSDNIFNEILKYVIANLPKVRSGFWQQCLKSLLTGANKNSSSTIDQNRLLTQQFLEALNSINSIEIRSFITGCSYETFTKLVEYMDNNTIEAPLLSKRLMHAPRYLSHYLGHTSPQKFDLLKINSILSAITKFPDVVQDGFIAQLDEHAVHKLAQLNDDPQSALPPEFSGFWDKVKNSASYSKFALNVLSPFNVDRDNYDALIKQLANNLARLSDKQLDSFWTELNLLQKSTIMLLQENKITNSLLTKICNDDKNFNTSYEKFKKLHPIISAPACATAIQQDPILFYSCIQQLHDVDKNLIHIISIHNKLPNILQSLQQINFEVRQTQFNGDPDDYESWLQSETKTRQKKHFELKLGADSDDYKYIKTTMDSYVAPLAALKQLLDWGLTNEQIQSLAQGLYPTARQCLNNLVRLNSPQYIAIAEATLPPEILADTDKLNMLKSTKILGTYVTDLTRPQFQQLIIIDHNGLPVINFTNIDISNHANIEHFKTQFETKINQAGDKDKIQLKLFTIQTLQTIILAKINAILKLVITQLFNNSPVNTEQNLKTLYVDIPSGKIYLQTTISVINNANEQCLTDYSADYSADFTLAENFTLPEQGADIIASDVITITKTSPLSKTESLELTNKIEEHVSNAIDVSQDLGQPSS